MKYHTNYGVRYLMICKCHYEQYFDSNGIVNGASFYKHHQKNCDNIA